MAFKTISDKPFTKQELLNRKLHLANAKLSTAAELANIFAMFCIYATVDLNINPGETSSELLTLFAVNTSLLVVCTVLVKIGVMYITPNLETALFMARYDIKELDQILHEDVIYYMQYVWVGASLLSSFLFSLNYIVIIWVKYKTISKTSVIAATIIMAPVLIFTVIFALYTNQVIRKRQGKILFNESEIRSGSSRVRYSKRTQTHSNNNSHVAANRWDLIRAHVYKGNTNKTHVV